jgi:hypothetical protein
MQYVVVALTGDIGGYIVKRAILTRQNRAFVGSLKECRAWIAGYQRAMGDLEEQAITAVTLTVVPWDELTQAS